VGYRVNIDTEECISAGRCVADHPTAFGFDDDELAVVLDGATALSDGELLAAARRCPSGAIRLTDGSGSTVDI